MVAILDADKEGFLRSERSLTQTAGRAARNINGKVIMYADKITDSMRRTIDETERRRKKQIEYNFKHNLKPMQLVKSKQSILNQSSVAGRKTATPKAYYENEQINYAADPVVQYMTKEQLQKAIAKTRKAMEVAAKDFDFIEAAKLRDEMRGLEAMLDKKK